MNAPRSVLCVWDDGNSVEQMNCPAVLVNENSVVAIFDEHVEIHMVEATNNPIEYKLIYASNPMFRVGKDFPSVVEDLVNLSFVEFAGKYIHSDFVHLTIQAETR